MAPANKLANPNLIIFSEFIPNTIFLRHHMFICQLPHHPIGLTSSWIIRYCVAISLKDTTWNGIREDWVANLWQVTPPLPIITLQCFFHAITNSRCVHILL